MKHDARGRAGLWLDRAVFASLLLLIPLTAVPYGSAEPWWGAAFESAVFGLGCLWAVEAALGAGWGLRGVRLILPPLALAAFAYCQTIPAPDAGDLWAAVSADPHGTRAFAARLFALTLAGALLLRYTSSPARLRALVGACLAAALASAAFGLARQAVQQGGEGFLLPHLEAGAGYGQFINRNHFAFLMEMALGLLLGTLAAGGFRRELVPSVLAAALPLWAALVLTGSRGAVVSMVAQAAALLLFHLIRRASSRPARGVARLRALLAGSLVTAALLALLCGGALWVGGDPLLSRIESLPAEVGAREPGAGRGGVGRPEIWRATLSMIKARPLLGSGLGAYGTAVTEHQEGSGAWTPQAAHNDYLELLAGGGLVGCAFAACFALALLRPAGESLRSRDRFRRGAACGALAGLFGVAVHSLFDFGLHVPANGLVFVALLAVLTLDVRAERRGLKSPGPVPIS